MANIEDKNTPWEGHSGLEVENFIKNMFDTKVGYIDFNNLTLTFYDEQGGTALGSFTIGGDIYRINIGASIPTVFYVLADETTTVMSLSPTTTKTPLGTQDSVPYSENYTYTVAIDNGSGYSPKIAGNISEGETVSFDLRNHLVVGTNKIRVSVTGMESDQTTTVVFTGIVSSLMMSCSHDWQNIWRQDSDYTITGIYFAGTLEKYLHVSVAYNGETTELPPVKYNANQSYVTTSTTYTIPASRFPADMFNGICSISVWMTAQGISTPVTTFNIMCVTAEDGTPLVAINEMSDRVFNFSSGKLFSYAVYNADSVSFDLVATLSDTTFSIVSGQEHTEREDAVKYDFVYDVAVDTGSIDVQEGQLTAYAVPRYYDEVGIVSSESTVFDNTYSYVATPGYLFYLNAATRDNSASNHDVIVNEASNPSPFAPSYNADWYGFSWNTDGWVEDEDNNRALLVPAGSHVSVQNFAPLSYYSSFTGGITIEMLVKAGHPSDYDEPILTICSGTSSKYGLQVYPTKVSMYGNTLHDDVVQSVRLSENTMTHIVVTIVKAYGNNSGHNLCSIYVNGISNANFSVGSDLFGNGSLYIGQQNTDVYLYKMRVYGTALESRAILNNYLNCIVSSMGVSRSQVDEDNMILDGEVVSYDLVKAAGLDTMVVDIPNYAALPSFNNNVSYSGCTLHFEYAGHPEKNVTVSNVGLEGQGTTSKQYFRWNLRSKTNSSTTWTYGDGEPVTGNTGRIINDSDYTLLDRITAKKNYASSMQGHKMGMTGLYNDLFKELGLGAHLPDPDYRVTVYQMPFVGFRSITEDQKEFIGLYTVGPDKGSNVTFGYDDTSYPNLLSLEGPDHNLRGVLFLHPWVDQEYDSGEKMFGFGGQAAWECSFAGSTGAASLFESEWGPAYEVVFNNSPYIVSASEMLAGLDGLSSLSDLCDEDNVEAIFAGTTNGYRNSLLSFYDDEYELYFYSTKESAFVKLSTVDSTREHNVVSALYSGGYLDTQTPTTAQIVSARAERFKDTMGDYWDIDQTLYHYCFCVLFGVTDNFAKNSYPFKFRGFSESLGTGESTYCKRWGWRQDDLDTVLATDNNGRSTKSYSVEHGDLNAQGNPLFQGGNSAMWVLVRDCFQDEIAAMMKDIAEAATSMAYDLGISGNYDHDSLFNLVSHYCWEKSARYFPQVSYEKDKEWSYIEPWLIDSSKKYNDVWPLDQALGDQYQAERLWVERRIAYIFSKYRIGAFTKDNRGYNRLDLTLSAPFTFKITPAIDLYPVASIGQSHDYPAYGGDRAVAGGQFNLWCDADGETTNYIHGIDWIASLGDLHAMSLSDRGAGTAMTFSIEGKRMQTLIVGNEDPSEMEGGFNARALQVSSPSIVTIDARNTSTVENIVDLSECPRLQTCLFSGSGAAGLLLPTGARLTEVSFPENAKIVYMHSLPLLTLENLALPTLSKIETLYINNCANINPLAVVKDIMDTHDNSLTNASLIWRDTKTVSQGQAEALVDLLEISGYVDEHNQPIAGKPYVSGSVTPSTTISVQTKEALEENYTALDITGDDSKFHIEFGDPEVERVAVANWGSNSKITLAEAKNVTNIGTAFRGNTSIIEFNELAYFGVVEIQGGNVSSMGAFASCSNLKSIILPNTVTSVGGWSFTYCYELESIVFGGGVQSIGTQAFHADNKLSYIDLPASVTSISTHAFSTNYNGHIDRVVIVRSYTAPTLGDNVFDRYISGINSLNNKLKIYVPLGYGEHYKGASGWSRYADYIFELDENGNIPE